jgi:hypothetical protein
LNSGLQTIGDGAFTYCTGFTSVNIPNTVTSIGSQAFYLNKMSSIIIGSGVTFIGLGAFEQNENNLTIEYAQINAVVPPTIEDGSSSYTFNGSYPIYVPYASVDAYKTAWPNYASRIQPIA